MPLFFECDACGAREDAIGLVAHEDDFALYCEGCETDGCSQCLIDTESDGWLCAYCESVLERKDAEGEETA
jgi:hypothetical protein